MNEPPDLAELWKLSPADCEALDAALKDTSNRPVPKIKPKRLPERKAHVGHQAIRCESLGEQARNE